MEKKKLIKSQFKIESLTDNTYRIMESNTNPVVTIAIKAAILGLGLCAALTIWEMVQLLMIIIKVSVTGHDEDSVLYNDYNCELVTEVLRECYLLRLKGVTRASILFLVIYILYKSEFE